MPKLPTPAERIYSVIRSIPPGRVATYGQVAALAGLPGHARQVGQALRGTPEGLDLPWQRVINAQGTISQRGIGYEAGLQHHLLQEEGVAIDPRGRIDLDRFGWDPDARPPAKAAARRKPPFVRQIETLLRPLGTPERAAGAKSYLKSDLDFLGVTTPDLRKAALAWLHDHPDLDRADLLDLVRSLWDEPVHELRAFGLELLTARRKDLRGEDLDLLEDLLRRSRSWAYVDTLAVQLAGPLVADPKQVRRLDRWVQDPDFWLRRSAVLALLLPLRRGEGDWARFVRYADLLLEEKEFFIRKALGWVLREVAKKRPELVRQFLREREGRVSGVTRREAEKYLGG
jgi:alkylated DNA nucleotide flippase Atl1/3-methyladenine DNA glycosylase AlkD